MLSECRRIQTMRTEQLLPRCPCILLRVQRNSKNARAQTAGASSMNAQIMFSSESLIEYCFGHVEKSCTVHETEQEDWCFKTERANLITLGGIVHMDENRGSKQQWN
ncbi:hypothetical protein Mapa_012087 [Marchantia paleacea]|nr:hypothetical protein Mapa_012087 [Marchantia paleacea]